MPNNRAIGNDHVNGSRMMPHPSSSGFAKSLCKNHTIGLRGMQSEVGLLFFEPRTKEAPVYMSLVLVDAAAWFLARLFSQTLGMNRKVFERTLRCQR
jgi:hypothetical protein